MKLAGLGAITAAVGIGLDLPGLIATGALWVLLGLLLRRFAAQLVPRPAGSAPTDQPTDARTFAAGTAFWILLGLPSFLVGLLELGIGDEHAQWRWLPLVVGAAALVVGVLGALLYLLGGALGGKAGPPTVPATLWIVSVSETGTFINERPRLQLELRVEPDAGSGLGAYALTKKATVPFGALGSLRVGDGFRALVVGPDDPTAMEIRWDAPVSAPRSVPDAPGTDVATRLAGLEELRASGQITEDEYAEQRARILGSI